MLEPEGYADDGDAEDHAPHEMCQGYGDAAYNPPYHVEYGGDAAVWRASGIDGRPEGPQGHAGQLECLQAEGYADDGYHHRETREHVLDRYHEAAEHRPDDVKEKIHCRQ